MGPKKKEKNKKEPPRPTKSQYLAKIAYMNAILAQVRKKTYHVEEVYFSAVKRFEDVQEDLADIMKYLEHEIKVCEDETEECNINTKKYSAQMEQQTKYYSKIFAKMEEEHEARKRELVEKIESVNAKLNSFEEIRQQKEEFLKKEATLQKMTEEMILRHKAEIYEAEKQSIMEQDKLQKDTEKKLFQLAQDFREATDIRIGETTNRIIEENIKLGNELLCQQQLLSKIGSNFLKIKKIQTHALLDLELKEDEYNLAFTKYSQYTGKIEELLQIIGQMTTKMEEMKKLTADNKRLKKKIEELECFLHDFGQEHSALSESLEEIEELTINAKRNLNILKKNLLRLQIILYDAAKKVKEAINCENVTAEDELAFSTQKSHIYGQEKTEVEREILYKKRQALIEEIMFGLQIGISSADELCLMESSSDFYDINFNSFSNLNLHKAPNLINQ